MANIYGRQVVVPLTNKSGGGVIAGDVVVVDTANDSSFTTTTTSASTATIGIAQETIANNASGRVLLAGEAALVNVNASVTRGHYGKTHTVAKQATDAGTSRITGTFCQFSTGGTTPRAMIFPSDLGGSGAATTDHFITTQAETDLSAEVARPELDDRGGSVVSTLDFSTSSQDSGAAYAAETNMAGSFTFTDVSTRRHVWVTSAIGTGDFDLRMRLTDFIITVPHTSASQGFLALYVADSSNTVGTRMSVQLTGPETTTAPSVANVIGVIGTASNGQLAYISRFAPIVLRLKRVGTTVTFYFSTNEGRFWQAQSTTTSSLNIARVGILGTGGSVGTQTSVALVDWFRTY